MTSSLEGEGGAAKRWHDDTGGGAGGERGWGQNTLFFTEILAKPMILNTFQELYQT